MFFSKVASRLARVRAYSTEMPLSGSKPAGTPISPPPPLFQNAFSKPTTYPDILTQQSTNTQKTIPLLSNTPFLSKVRTPASVDSSKLNITQLFTDKSTRGSTFKLLISFCLLQVAIFYVSSDAIMHELSESESKLLELWGFYERKDISQTVMAVHIGQLRQQLIKAGIKPVTTAQSLMVAQHLLSFDRDDTGNLLIYVDPNSQIYKLVPFSYEYDIQKIPKLNNIVDTTWEDFNNENEYDSDASSTLHDKVVGSDNEGKEKK